MVTNAKPRERPHPIHHEVDFGDRAVGGKRLLQVIFSGVEGKISDKQFCNHSMICCSRLTFFQTVPDHRVSNHH